MAFVRHYVQDGYLPPQEAQLDEETYRKVLGVWVKACVDAILYFRDPFGYRMVIGHRKIQPQKGWWIFGGRVLHGESYQQAIARKLSQEIGLKIDLERIPKRPLLVNKYEWADDNSSVSAVTFPVEISGAEYRLMVSNLPSSPEYMDLFDHPPMKVRDGEIYHPALRDCAGELIYHLEGRH